MSFICQAVALSEHLFQSRNFFKYFRIFIIRIFCLDSDPTIKEPSGRAKVSAPLIPLSLQYTWLRQLVEGLLLQ
jgi:hypothetical protein